MLEYYNMNYLNNRNYSESLCFDCNLLYKPWSTDETLEFLSIV